MGGAQRAVLHGGGTHCGLIQVVVKGQINGSKPTELYT